MNRCPDCIHYRDGVLVAERLSLALGSMARAVSDVLLSLTKDERDRRDAEIEQRFELMRAQIDRWVSRPLATPYCGIDEDSGTYRVCEVKNSEGDCGDFADRPVRAAPCKTCVHRVPARGPEFEARTVADVEAAAQRVHVEVGPGVDVIQPSSVREDFNARRALELSHAFHFGAFAEPPMFFDVCKARSRPGRSAVCALANRHDRCALHEEGATSLADLAVAGTPKSGEGGHD